MKKFFTLMIFTGFAALAHAQCNIPNAGFENWEDDEVETITQEKYAFESPAGWDMLLGRLIVAFGGGKTPGIGKSTDARSGTYAAQISAATDENGGYAADLIAIIPCDQKVGALTGYYKLTGDKLDTVNIAVAATKYNTNTQQSDTIATGAIRLTTEKKDYTKFTVNFFYPEDITPDTVAIIILSQARDFLLDDLSFGEATSSDRPNLSTVSVFPNPTSQQTTVSGLVAGHLVTLFDQTGRVVEHVTATRELHQFNGLTPGMYLVSVSAESGKRVQKKLVVQ